MIPEAAIKAAEEAMYDRFGWEEGTLEKEAQAILEAAAPHMLAEFDKQRKYEALAAISELGDE